MDSSGVARVIEVIPKIGSLQRDLVLLPCPSPQRAKALVKTAPSHSGCLGGQMTGTMGAHFVAVPQATSAWLSGAGFWNKQVVVTGSHSRPKCADL